MLRQDPKSLYASFDTFPAPKGAATHIRYMAQTLFKLVPPGCLYVIGGEGLPAYQQNADHEIVRFSMRIENYLERTIAFTQSLYRLVNKHGEHLELCHFRDPWSGFPILSYQHKQSATFKTIYEVNGLPSIELPYAYPSITSATLEKIYQQEQLCLTHCSHIITPAKTIKNQLIRRGLPETKITVIPNGANLIPALPKPVKAPEHYLIYSGALQEWQGVDDLLRCFNLLRDYENLHLVLCLSKHNRIAKQYRKLADKLEITDKLIWHYGLPQESYFPWLQHALLSIAPLTNCSRNIEQGCAPLKILESMAAAVPVVASDLLPVREILTDQLHGRLVRAGRPEELALTIRTLLDHPDVIETMGKQARRHIAQHFTWQHATKKLEQLVKGFMIYPRYSESKPNE